MRSRIIETLDLGALSFLIPDFTFMLTLPLVLGALITLRQRRRQGLSEAHSYQSVFYAVLFVIPGARLVYFLQYPHHFSVRGHPESGQSTQPLVSWNLFASIHQGETEGT